MFALFKSKRKDIDAAKKLYEQITAQARQPVFYELYGVPDTVEGRFDLICLHVFLVMDRLFQEKRAGVKMAQLLFDVMFRDMDRSLREMGVGDLSLPKHVKRMMKGFNGRATSYQDAMHDENPYELVEVLLRNLYGSVENPPRDMAQIMALYMHESAAWLEVQSWEELSCGNISFKEMDYYEGEGDDNRNDLAGMVA